MQINDSRNNVVVIVIKRSAWRKKFKNFNAIEFRMIDQDILFFPLYDSLKGVLIFKSENRAKM